MHNQYTLIHSILKNGLNTSLVILEKGKAFAAEKGIPETDLLNAALAPDMFTFTRQIQIVSDNAKSAVARFAEVEAPKMEDTETTFDQLTERIKKTIDYVNTFSPESFANADNVKVTFPWMPGKYFEMQNYIEGFVTQNFHFHVSIAYAILRNKGVNLGKQDYISGLIPKDLA
jgi:hypothetical protein